MTAGATNGYMKKSFETETQLIREVEEIAIQKLVCSICTMVQERGVKNNDKFGYRNIARLGSASCLRLTWNVFWFACGLRHVSIFSRSADDTKSFCTERLQSG